MTAPDTSGVARGEFSLLLPVALRAGRWAHVCPLLCGRKSARAFWCVDCSCKSVTAEQAAAFANADSGVAP